MNSAPRILLAVIIAYLITLSLVAWACDPNHAILPSTTVFVFQIIPVLLFARTLAAAAMQRVFKGYGTGLILLFLVVAGLSFLYNGASLFGSILNVRLFIPYYLLFLVIINLDLDDRQVRILVWVVFGVFLSQIPIAAVKWAIFGQGETGLGLVGKARSTYLALAGASFAVAYWLIYRPAIPSVCLCMAFLGVGIAGGKRATVFLLPFVLATPILIGRKWGRHFRQIVAIVTVLLPFAFYLSLRAIPSLNPDDVVWGRFDPQFALEYAGQYANAETKRERRAGTFATGYSSATVTVFETLMDAGTIHFLIGFGPDALLQSRFSDSQVIERSGVEYGMNDLNWFAFQFGYLGAMLWFLLYMAILRIAVLSFYIETEPFWQAFALGMIASCLLASVVAFYYQPLELLSPYFFTMAAVSYRRWDQCGGCT